MSGFTAADAGFEERIRDSFNRQNFMATMGAELAHVAPGEVHVRLPHDAKLLQQHHFFHGGATGSIADSAMGYAAYSLFPADATVLTVEYKINFLAPATGEALMARARVRKPGRTLSVVECDVMGVEGGAEKLVATCQATMICVHGKADAAGMVAS